MSSTEPCPPPEDSTPKCYAAWAEDSIRQQSSSGGIFTVLAQQILRDGGTVYGVGAHNQNEEEIERFSFTFLRAENERELSPMRGSKYVQAKIADAYAKVMQDLADGKKVLFTGTPCQVAAMRHIAGNKPNLYTVDVLCHGVPSQKMLREYLNEKYPEAVNIYFRDKRLGWQANFAVIENADGTEVVDNIQQSVYGWFFWGNNALQPACYDCPFQELPRYGDISMGDAWGVEYFRKDFNDGRGTSLLMINNNHGNRLLDMVRNRFSRMEAVPLEMAVKFNRCHAKIKMPLDRQHFIDLWSSGRYALTDAALRAANHRFDIGLVGNWLGKNYGGQITYFALYSFLHDQLGYDVLMIEAPLPNSTPFQKNMFLTSPYPKYAACVETYSNLFALNDLCDKFVLGSDQNWNAQALPWILDWSSLAWVSNDHIKIAYAASFGGNYVYPSRTQKNSMKYHFQKFDAISVREKVAVKALATQYDVTAEHVLDPVFICDKERYVELAAKSSVQQRKKSIFAYILDIDDGKLSLLLSLAEKTGAKYNIITDKNRENEFFEGKYKDDLTLNSSVEDWLAHIMNSSLVVTDSFHGMCFAIIFHKPFIVVVNKDRGADRFYSLAELLGVQDRLFDSPQVAMQNFDMLMAQSVDWSKIESNLEKCRQKSRQWLENALGIQKTSIATEYNLLAPSLMAHNEHIKHIQDCTYLDILPNQTRSGKGTRLILGDQLLLLQVYDEDKTVSQSSVAMRDEVSVLEKKINQLEHEIVTLKSDTSVLKTELINIKKHISAMYQTVEKIFNGTIWNSFKDMLPKLNR